MRPAVLAGHASAGARRSKGYFVSTRFSGDLDFTAPTGLHPGQLLDALNSVCRMVQARTGVEFDLDRNAQTDQRSIDSGKTVHKFTLYFKNFYGQASKMTIALRKDVTEFGRLYLPIQQRKLIHPYSDQADCATTLEVVNLEEALADKLKGLLQRQMSSDLFDLVYSIFVNNDIAVDKTTIVTTFLRKTIFEPSPQAALGLLPAVPFEVMRAYWSKIVCVTESRMDFTAAVDRFKGELRSLFSSSGTVTPSQLAFFPGGAAHANHALAKAGEYGERTTFFSSRRFRCSALDPGAPTPASLLPGALRLLPARIRPDQPIHGDAPAPGQLR